MILKVNPWIIRRYALIPVIFIVTLMLDTSTGKGRRAGDCALIALPWRVREIRCQGQGEEDPGDEHSRQRERAPGRQTNTDRWEGRPGEGEWHRWWWWLGDDLRTVGRNS